MAAGDDISCRLVKLKEEIDSAKTSKAQAEGALEQVKTTLKSEHSLNTVKAAKEKLDEMDTEVQQLEKELKDGLVSLEGQFGW